mmetsp:Transcript_114057/g.198244  ORF Transcript_114057/g.198244 Transcript_114057/m.198244 type:complete len:89 (-) Transcript_114057:160-426(-)
MLCAAHETMKEHKGWGKPKERTSIRHLTITCVKWLQALFGNHVNQWFVQQDLLAKLNESEERHRKLDRNSSLLSPAPCCSCYVLHMRL